MVDADDFRLTVRTGVRAGQSAIVAHAVAPVGAQTKVGFVVSKAVGSAVTRNRVKRRLRHLMREQIPFVQPGSHIVIRALPAAAALPSQVLSAQLGTVLDRCGVRLISPPTMAH